MKLNAKTIVLGIAAVIAVFLAVNTYLSLTAPTSTERNLEEFRERIGN